MILKVLVDSSFGSSHGVLLHHLDPDNPIKDQIVVKFSKLGLFQHHFAELTMLLKPNLSLAHDSLSKLSLLLAHDSLSKPSLLLATNLLLAISLLLTIDLLSTLALEENLFTNLLKGLRTFLLRHLLNVCRCGRIVRIISELSF